MASRDSQTFVLPDGRTLGYAEYGSPDGTPVLFFHGFPSCRLEAAGIDAIARRRRLRVLALDRPGYGLSTAQPSRRIVDWPADVRCFADHAGLARFAVLGGSGGGPYALACARDLPPSILSAVGVMAGAMPWQANRKDVMWSSWFAYLAATYWPSGLRVLSAGVLGLVRWVSGTAWAKKKIDALLERTATGETKETGVAKNGDDNATADDKTPLLNKDEATSIAMRRERLLRMVFEPFSQGTGETVREIQLLTQDWGFKFEDVKYDSIKVWHGAEDRNAPISMMRYMVDRLPHCEFKVYEGENHFAVANHLEDIMTELLGEEATELPNGHDANA